MKLIFLLLLTACSIEPRYDLEEIRYCKRSDESYVCRGYGNKESTLDWTVRKHKEYTVIED